MSAAPKVAKESRSAQRGHPVPLPADWWTGEPRGTYALNNEHAKLRRESGYTSLRVSKATARLIRELENHSREGRDVRRAVGADALLYWDALERLGRLPDALAGRSAKKPARDQ